MWAISKQLGRQDATKIDEFWDASPDAAQKRSELQGCAGGVMTRVELVRVQRGWTGERRRPRAGRRPSRRA